MNKNNKREDIKKSVVSSFIAPPINKVLSEKTEITEIKENINNNKENKNINLVELNKTNNYKFKNNVNLNDNYITTFKIDADIEEYLKLIEKITFIENMKKGKVSSTTKTEFVNKLIRDEYYKLIGATDRDTIEDINNKWLVYKSKNNL